MKIDHTIAIIRKKIGGKYIFTTIVVMAEAVPVRVVIVSSDFDKPYVNMLTSKDSPIKALVGINGNDGRYSITRLV